MTWSNMNNNNNNPCSSNSNINTNEFINISISEKSSSSSFNNDGLIIVGSNINNNPLHTLSCPSCAHHLPLHNHPVRGFNDLPMGVKFDPTDPEIVEHLQVKVKSDLGKLHPLLHQFIPIIEGENGICYTHPNKLPGVRKDGVMRHFFHCPSKAYTTGTRKRRKVHTDDDNGGKTRWHKTGKTRPILVNGEVKGYKKILVLYTNYGRQRKAEKTNWIMHQYHLGKNEEEKDGEYVLSKVFYQTQPRQCGTITMKESPIDEDYNQPRYLSYDDNHYRKTNCFATVNPFQTGSLPSRQGNSLEDISNRSISEENVSQLIIPNLAVQGDGSLFDQVCGERR